MSLEQYPHLHDPIRIQIAIDYVQHETRKILPGIKDKEIWSKIDHELAGLFTNPTMAPIRDFWNYIDSVCFGLKLKNLVPRLTSDNTVWEKRELDINEIVMGSKGSFRYLDAIETKNPTGAEVREFLFSRDHQKILEEVKKDSAYNSQKTYDRDHFHMIVVEKENKIIVHDGNRRLIKNILEQTDKMEVYYGKVVDQPEIFNHWVPTSHMMSLAKHANIFFDAQDNEAALSLIHALANITKYSDVARTELGLRVLGFMEDERRKQVELELEKIWSE